MASIISLWTKEFEQTGEGLSCDALDVLERATTLRVCPQDTCQSSYIVVVRLYYKFSLTDESLRRKVRISSDRPNSNLLCIGTAVTQRILRLHFLASVEIDGSPHKRL